MTNTLGEWLEREMEHLRSLTPAEQKVYLLAMKKADVQKIARSLNIPLSDGRTFKKKRQLVGAIVIALV